MKDLLLRISDRARHQAADKGQLSRDIKLKTLGRLRAPLKKLAELSGTDKTGAHGFIPAYERFFSEYRHRSITLLEIGVGGYQELPGGHSLKLWEAYFQRGTIVGIDIYDKRNLSHGRVHVHQCSQVDSKGLHELADKHGGFDIIIDDGSHLNDHQIESFTILFPLLKTPGIYVIEDVQTSYWPAFGGGKVGTPGHARSAVSFFKELIDGLNHAEYLAGAQTKPFHRDTLIRGIYFEHNLIVIEKGDNSRASNIALELCSNVLERTDTPPESLNLPHRWKRG
jgi:hypothetical protein